MTDPALEPSQVLKQLARRHARMGVVALLLFLTLGGALEALHGFKLGFYLDVGNEARLVLVKLLM